MADDPIIPPCSETEPEPPLIQRALVQLRCDSSPRVRGWAERLLRRQREQEATAEGDTQVSPFAVGGQPKPKGKPPVDPPAGPEANH